MCGTHELSLYKPGYDFFLENASSDSISTTYALHTRPELTFLFNQVGISEVDEYVAEPDGAAETELNYTICSVSGVTDMVIVNMTSEREQYYMSNNLPVTDQEGLPTGCIEASSCSECAPNTDGFDENQDCLGYFNFSRFFDQINAFLMVCNFTLNSSQSKPRRFTSGPFAPLRRKPGSHRVS